MRSEILFALALIPSVSNAQAFRNGSFTEGAYEKGKGFIELVAGSTAITGWTVVSGNIDWVNDDWKASDGKRSMDLSGTVRGAVSQTFSTQKGRKYRVLFDLAGNPLGIPDVKRLRVTVTGAKAQMYSFSIKGHYNSKMGWVAESYMFLASSAKSTLKFASLTDGSYGPCICHVRVAEIVPPKSRRR